MPDVLGRPRAASVALIAAAIIVSIIPTAASSATKPPGLDKFLYALGEVESGGNYNALNVTSGAYGKYQIMPSNWPGWAKLYIGSATAPQTPANPERVARGKVTDLWHWLDTWPNVAHWWLTGSGETNQALWSAYSKKYVARIMAIYKSVSAGTATAAAVPPKGEIQLSVTRVGDSNAAIRYGGTWKLARHDGYAGDRVRYATADGAKATFTFVGRSFTWIGPVGATRGKARVSIDGTAVATVDLRRSTFMARVNLFSKTWSTPGKHTVVIEVLSSGKPVAIDEFVTKR